MHTPLLKEIDEFLSETGLGPHRFGILAAKNGRLVERLRAGRRIWPDTESQIREFMASERLRRSGGTHAEAAE